MEHLWDYKADDTVVCGLCGLDYNQLTEGQQDNCPDVPLRYRR